MPLVTKETLKKEEEEADKLLVGISEAGEPKPTEESKVLAEEAKPKVLEGQEGIPAEQPPTGEQPASESAEIQKLQSEIAALKAQLEDENSPTNKQRYNSLQGIYNKAIRDQEAMQERLEKLEKAKEPPKEEKPPAASDFKSEVLDNMTKDYGEGVFDVLMGIATTAAQKVVADQLATHSERVSNVEKGQSLTRRDIFHNSLSGKVPDWKQINGWEPEKIPANVKWSEFLLNNRYPGTNTTYNDALISAYDSYDVDRVSEIFDLFKKAEGVPPSATNGDTPPEKEEPKPSDKLSKFIEPDTSGSGGAPDKTQDKRRTYTTAEVDKFYNSVAKGTFDGTRDEREKMDAVFSQAIVEGRVL